jgi:hypothetical protein
MNRAPKAQQLKEVTNGTTSNLKAIAQEREQSLSQRDRLQNGRKPLPAKHLTKINSQNIHRAQKTTPQRINNPLRNGQMN